MHLQQSKAKHQRVLFYLLAIGLQGCGASSTSVGPSQAAAVAIPSSTIIADWREAAKTIDLAKLRTTPTAAIYQQLLSEASDRSFFISDLGIQVSQVHSQLLAHAAAFAHLSQVYPTVGSLLDSGLLASPSEVTADSVRASLTTLGRSHLGLVDSTVTGIKQKTEGTPAPHAPAGHQGTRIYEYTVGGKLAFSCEVDPNIAGGIVPFRIDSRLDQEQRLPTVRPGVYVLTQGTPHTLSDGSQAIGAVQMDQLAQSLESNWEGMGPGPSGIQGTCAIETNDVSNPQAS